MIHFVARALYPQGNVWGTKYGYQVIYHRVAYRYDCVDPVFTQF